MRSIFPKRARMRWIFNLFFSCKQKRGNFCKLTAYCCFGPLQFFLTFPNIITFWNYVQIRPVGLGLYYVRPHIDKTSKNSCRSERFTHIFCENDTDKPIFLEIYHKHEVPQRIGNVYSYIYIKKKTIYFYIRHGQFSQRQISSFATASVTTRHERMIICRSLPQKTYTKRFVTCPLHCTT